MGRKPKPDPRLNAKGLLWESLSNLDRDIVSCAFVLGRMTPQNVQKYSDGHSLVTIQRHLRHLTDIKVLKRWRPLLRYGDGSHPYIYQLDRRGWYPVRRMNLCEPGYRRKIAIPEYYSPHLRHWLLVNESVLKLFDDTTTEVDKPFILCTDSSLMAVGEPATSMIELPDGDEGLEHFILRPDARVDFEIDYEDDLVDLPNEYIEEDLILNHRVPVYLEVDRGTEKLAKVESQLNAYAGAYLVDCWLDQPSDFPIVLWIVKGEKRTVSVCKMARRIVERESRDVIVRTNRNWQRGIESTWSLDHLFFGITTEEMFFRSKSAHSDSIWFTPGKSDRLVSLMDVIWLRNRAAMEDAIKRRRLQDLVLKKASS
jgi:hypothetical protein